MTESDRPSKYIHIAHAHNIIAFTRAVGRRSSRVDADPADTARVELANEARDFCDGVSYALWQTFTKYLRQYVTRRVFTKCLSVPTVAGIY